MGQEITGTGGVASTRAPDTSSAPAHTSDPAPDLRAATLTLIDASKELLRVATEYSEAMRAIGRGHHELNFHDYSTAWIARGAIADAEAALAGSLTDDARLHLAVDLLYDVANEWQGCRAADETLRYLARRVWQYTEAGEASALADSPPASWDVAETDSAYRQPARTAGPGFVECTKHPDCFRETGHSGACERSDGMILRT